MRLRSIVAVAGNASAYETALNARAVLDIIGAAEVPVFRIGTRPARSLIANETLRQTLLNEKAPVRRQGKIETIRASRIRNISKGITFYAALGPLSAAKINAGHKYNSCKYVILGGDITQSSEYGAEFNFAFDPPSARSFFSKKTDAILIPVNVCRVVDARRFLLPNTERLSPSARLWNAILVTYANRHDSGLFPLFDPLAIFYLLKPEAFTIEKMSFGIDSSGFMRVDGSYIGKLYTANVVTSIDADALIAELRDTFLLTDY